MYKFIDIKLHVPANVITNFIKSYYFLYPLYIHCVQTHMEKEGEKMGWKDGKES